MPSLGSLLEQARQAPNKTIYQNGFDLGNPQPRQQRLDQVDN